MISRFKSRNSDNLNFRHNWQRCSSQITIAKGLDLDGKGRKNLYSSINLKSPSEFTHVRKPTSILIESFNTAGQAQSLKREIMLPIDDLKKSRGIELSLKSKQPTVFNCDEDIGKTDHRPEKEISHAESFEEHRNKSHNTSILMNHSASKTTSYNGSQMISDKTIYGKLLVKLILELDFKCWESLHIFCHYCKQKGIPQSQIDDFKRYFEEETPVYCYTRESFLYSMINSSLWQFDYSTIEKAAFFIQKLHDQLVQLQSTENQHIQTCYRGQGLTKEVLDRLLNSVGGLICFDNFLSTTVFRSYALEGFARTKINGHNTYAVLLQITIDPQISRKNKTPYASVSRFSAFGASEGEILFSTHTVFRIDAVKKLEDETSNQMYEFHLSMVDEETSSFKEIYDTLNEEVSNRVNSPWSKFIWILLKLKLLDQVKSMCQQLLIDEKDKKQEIEYYYFLGLAHYQSDEYSEALEIFEKVLIMNQTTPIMDSLTLADFYCDLGNVYNAMGRLPEASFYYEKAVNIELPSKPDQDYVKCKSLLGEGLIQHIQGNLSTAETFADEAVLICNESLLQNKKSDVVAAAHEFAAKVAYAKQEYDVMVKHLENEYSIFKDMLPDGHPHLEKIFANQVTKFGNVRNDNVSKYFEELSKRSNTTIPVNYMPVILNSDIDGVYDHMVNKSAIVTESGNETIEENEEGLNEDAVDVRSEPLDFGHDLILAGTAENIEVSDHLSVGVKPVTKIIPLLSASNQCHLQTSHETQDFMFTSHDTTKEMASASNEFTRNNDNDKMNYLIHLDPGDASHHSNTIQVVTNEYGESHRQLLEET